MRKSKLYLIGPTESILTRRGNRFPNMATFFEEEGKEVVYYTSNFYHAEKRFFSKQEIREAKQSLGYDFKVLKVLGYYSNVSPRRVLSNFFFSIQLFFMLLFKVNKHDKIVLPSRPVELIFFMTWLKHLKGVEIYLDIQDIWPDALEIENKRKKKIFEVYCNMFLKPSLKYYTAAFHVAPSFKLWLRRYAKNTPSSFVPLGWENKRWKTFKKTNSKNGFRLNLVCVAQLQHQIDVMPILEMIKSQQDCYFTIIGEDGSGQRYPEVKSYIDTNKLFNVKIIGKVAREEMKDYLEPMDIGVLPMITPSIPNKIFDYLASELPIIVLGQNDSANFVRENNIGWSCNYNSDELIKIVTSITTDALKNKTEEVVKVKDRFSRDKLHIKIKELIYPNEK
ncbi:glycosyltransferase [Winogradskyella ouciana]|uniref:glycosyltransferase n=1 Tax=Winogradskyella ouciana TaxID=2608631 RepID=UPI003D2778BF